jgi:hypothetical protein
MEEKTLKEKVMEKVDEIEVDLVLQRELVGVLEGLRVSGAQAAEVAQRLAAARAQLGLSEMLFNALKAKYESDSTTPEATT